MTPIPANDSESRTGTGSYDQTALMNEMAHDWAFFGERASGLYPAGHSESSVEPGKDQAAYAYWLIEDALCQFTRAIAGKRRAGSRGYQHEVSLRARGLMLKFYRDGKYDLAECERKVIGRILAKASKLHEEKSRAFEEAA